MNAADNSISRTPRQPKQWAGIGGVFFLLTLIAVLAIRCDRTRVLQNEHRKAAANHELASQKREEIGAQIDEFEKLSDRFGTQKEKLVAEISEFQTQLLDLKARTRKLEMAHEDLAQLEKAMESHSAAQKRFEANLRRLEQTTPVGVKP